MGKVLFWGGVTGMAVSLIVFIIILVYLRRERKKIQENQEKKYG